MVSPESEFWRILISFFLLNLQRKNMCANIFDDITDEIIGLYNITSCEISTYSNTIWLFASLATFVGLVHIVTNVNKDLHSHLQLNFSSSSQELLLYPWRYSKRHPSNYHVLQDIGEYAARLSRLPDGHIYEVSLDLLVLGTTYTITPWWYLHTTISIYY